MITLATGTVLRFEAKEDDGCSLTILYTDNGKFFTCFGSVECDGRVHTFGHREFTDHKKATGDYIRRVLPHYLKLA